VSEPLTETSSMSKTGSAPEAMGVRSLQMWTRLLILVQVGDCWICALARGK
jgi:hypothetical protein